MRKRTEARQLALQMLYQLDTCGGDLMDEIVPFLKRNTQNNDTISYAKELILGTWEKRTHIDKLIGEVAKNWQINRMAIVDRNVLRIGTYELLFKSDIPPAVAINEAIDIAKKFSTKSSGQFVNGILDTIRIRNENTAKGVEPLSGLEKGQTSVQISNQPTQ